MPRPTAHALLIAPGTYADTPQISVPITAAEAGALAKVLRASADDADDADSVAL
ncbi:hypothetical protein [Candidatus Chloroploca asiatica]|uniref:hypothetical protein n=1 Tax=Candidatus Chloroploca asiatica TaxID=1506545 RepID=UPI00155894B6|nr:hypothetical protein [Candidatus Chloroploca asiatica]